MSRRGSHYNYSDFDSDIDNHNKNVNDVDVNFYPDFVYDDDDVVDIDMSDKTSVDEMLVSVDGDIDYNPGDDVTIEEILNGALNGAGNDAGAVVTNTNQLSDNDDAYNTTATNNNNFTQNLNARGGDAVADDGIASGGRDVTEEISHDAWAYGHGSWYYGHSHGMHTDFDGNLEIENLGNGSATIKAGDDALVEGLSTAEASASNDTSAFTNKLVQGENVLFNTVEMTVVGGGSESFSTGEDLVGS